MHRIVAAMVTALALTGCFGTPAKDLQPPVPQHDAPDVWRFAAGTDDLLEPTAADADLSARFRLTGHLGAEPNVGVTQSGAIFMTSYDETLRSVDGGRTWETVYDFAPPFGDGGTETADPMLWVDTVTDAVYTNHMYPALLCFAVAWSPDDGASWNTQDQSCTLPGVDHQKFVTAIPGPAAPPMAGEEHPTVLLQCYQRYFHPTMMGVPDPLGVVPGVGGYSTHCNISYDGGASWPAETTAAARLPGGASCGGINGHPAVAPDGTIALPITRGCDGLYVSVSLDSGLTWTVRPGPKGVGAESIDPELAFSPDGTLYALWRGTDHLLHLARSADLGLEWEGPWRVSPPHVTSTAFQALAAADGQVAFGFLGSPDTSQEPSEAGNETHWNLYVGVVTDAGAATPTVSMVQANHDRDPIQRGCIWLYGGGHPCRNMLDFIDGAVAPDGTFHVAFTKGCQDCASIKDEDKTSLTALATLDGFRLGVAP